MCQSTSTSTRVSPLLPFAAILKLTPRSTPGGPFRNSGMRNTSGGSVGTPGGSGLSGNTNTTNNSHNHSPNDSVALAIAAVEARLQSPPRIPSLGPGPFASPPTAVAPPIAMEDTYEAGEIKDEEIDMEERYGQHSE